MAYFIVGEIPFPHHSVFGITILGNVHYLDKPLLLASIIHFLSGVESIHGRKECSRSETEVIFTYADLRISLRKVRSGLQCLILGSDKPECKACAVKSAQAHVRLRLRQQGPRRPAGQNGGRVFLRRLPCRQLCWMQTLMGKTVTIGTRGSKLALWQAEWVRGELRQRFPETPVELRIIKTQGDRILDVPLAQVGGKGLFVKEIEEALLAGRVDLAVHSMKDMPAEVPAGLAIGAVPERESPADVLITRGAERLQDLAHGSLIGTSSLRRAAQLRHARPDLGIVPLRAAWTRLRKLDAGDLSDRPGTPVSTPGAHYRSTIPGSRPAPAAKGLH
jgi:hypothetical protein